MGAEFKQKIVAFIDILGFSNLVRKAESGEDITLEELLAAVACLRGSKVGDEILKNGPVYCHKSPFCDDKLDYCITQVSDSVVISCEATPVGAVNIVHHCFSIVYNLLNKNLLCRGYINIGNLYHSGHTIIGSAYMEAVSKEKHVKAFSKSESDSGVPFVEVDKKIVDLVNSLGDQCIRKSFRMSVFGDGKLHAIYPFERMLGIQRFGVSGNIEEDRNSLALIKDELKAFLKKAATYIDAEDERAYKKFAYYCDALNAEIAKCDEIKKDFEMLNAPFPRNLITVKSKK